LIALLLLAVIFQLFLRYRYERQGAVVYRYDRLTSTVCRQWVAQPYVAATDAIDAALAAASTPTPAPTPLCAKF